MSAPLPKTTETVAAELTLLVEASKARLEMRPSYEKAVKLVARILSLCRNNSASTFEEVSPLREEFHYHHEAVNASSTAATALFEKAGANYNKTLKRAAYYRDQLYTKIAESNTAHEELDSLRHQLRATSEASHDYDVKKKLFRGKSWTLGGIMRDIKQSRERVGTWDRRVERRRQELKTLCEEAEEKQKELESLDIERGRIQEMLDALGEDKSHGAEV